ncbi:MAG: L,D-transpeptidase family protein [Pseudomonadota bacterium]
MRKFVLIASGIILLPIAAVVFLGYAYFEASPRDLGQATRVEVYKENRELVLLDGSKELARYSIALGGDPIGHKVKEGDSRTPEGSYVLDWRNNKSSFYRSIHISYPNAKDIENAKKLGVSAGGDIMIHGQPNGYGMLAPFTQLKDWTDGCIAVSDLEMEEIWRAVPNGTPIEIKP